MQQGIESRLIIHKVLKDLRLSSVGFDEVFKRHSEHLNLKNSDKKLIHSVVFGALRNFNYIDEIINFITKKIKKDSNEYFLLLSSITQLIILDFKEFAVIHSTVELSKLRDAKSPSKFINAVLRNILRKKIIIKNKIISQIKQPKWFLKRISFLDQKSQLNLFDTIKEKPGLHIVFKKDRLKNINIESIKTSDKSLYFKTFKELKTINGYKEGNFWVQDLSSMMPIHISSEINKKKAIDLCAAPGGKTFQLIDKGCKVDCFDKNIKKIELMNQNLKRLKYNCIVTKQNVLSLKNKKLYDLVLLDAPCSSLGTVRRNPEILYRNQEPNFNKIIQNQYNLLEKAVKILKKNGILIYLVCSFLKEEGEKQIYKILDENKNLSIEKFVDKNIINKNLINNDGFFYTLPQKINNVILIDGFFAAKIKKND